MTTLSLGARNMLIQDAPLTALLGKSASWTSWIFDQKPVNVKVEGTSRCLVVINEGRPWTSPNGHNTMRFPTLVVDIWADPTRNADKSVKFWDSTTKIETIQKELDRLLHLIDPSTPDGMPRMWGTAAQVAARTGVVIAECKRASGPEITPIRDSDGSLMGKLTYNVNLP